VFAQGEGFDKFWIDHVQRRERKFLFLVGRGFDSRALKAVRRIVDVGVKADLWLLIRTFTIWTIFQVFCR
jgi:hypothetical protein